MTTHAFRTRLFAVAALAATLNACGGDKETPAQKAEADSKPKVTQVIPGTGQGKGDNKGGAFDPHPAACSQACSGVSDVTAVASCPATVGTAVPCEGFCYVDPSITPTYDNEPPSSGPVYPTYAYTWNEHLEVVPRGSWVHNLAHGFVVLTYNCPGGCEADLAVLRGALTARAGARLLMTPDPLLVGSKFAAMAWNWQYTFDAVDRAQLLCFIDQHVGHDFMH